MQTKSNDKAGERTQRKVFLSYFSIHRVAETKVIEAEVEQDHGGYYTIKDHGVWEADHVHETERDAINTILRDIVVVIGNLEIHKADLIAAAASVSAKLK